MGNCCNWPKLNKPCGHLVTLISSRLETVLCNSSCITNVIKVYLLYKCWKWKLTHSVTRWRNKKKQIFQNVDPEIVKRLAAGFELQTIVASNVRTASVPKKKSYVCFERTTLSTSCCFFWSSNRSGNNSKAMSNVF